MGQSCMSIILVGEEEIQAKPSQLTISPQDGSIGIDEIRSLIDFVSVGRDKKVLIKQAHLMTISAQNALLKTLEESPGNAEISLQTTYIDQLLPTIISRCIIVFQKIEKPKITDSLPTLNSIHDRLVIAKEKSKDRGEAILYIDSLLIASKNDLNPSRIRDLFNAKKYLKAYCNTRLVLENLFLNW